jgi:uncharacterized 2Fe-2S/4Fe-4S cluster protein (DUF4445 family)
VAGTGGHPQADRRHRGADLDPIRRQGLLGLAVDTGTTKLAAYLDDLATGETLGRVGAMNPQTAYGEDVVTRITYTNTAEGAAELLHGRLVGELNHMVGELCEQTGAHRGQIVDAVVVGNTAMHHFVARLPVRQLGEAPDVACVSVPVLGRHFHPIPPPSAAR